MLRSIFRLAERSVPNPRGGSAEDCAFRDRSSLDCAFEATGLMPANQGTYIGRDCCSSRRGLADYRRKGSCISCPAWRVIVEQPACAPSSVARSTAFRVSSGPPRGSSQTTTRSRLHSFWQGQPVRSSESSCLSKCIFPGRIASGNYNLKARLKCFSCGTAAIGSAAFAGRLPPLSVLCQFSGELLLVRQQLHGAFIGAFYVR